MKIIDLLNKIAKGEEVPGFYYDNNLFLGGLDGSDLSILSYLDEEKSLNDEVEIIEEEKEIEFDNFSSYTYNVGRVDETNIEEYIHILFSQQTKLIENQKKIIDVINDMRDKE